jgi:AraC-like DNA-binding protein
MNARELPPAADSLPLWQTPTSLASWGLAIARALEARGCDAAAIFAEAGLDFSVLDDPDARLPVRSPSRLWPLAVAATKDPCFGLEVARHVSPTTFHALGFSLAASASLREAFERVARYYRLVSDAAAVHFEPCPEGYMVSLSVDRTEPPAEAIDAIFALAVGLCRTLATRDFGPLRVEMRRPPPPDPTPFHRFFRAPITFGAVKDAITLDRATCDRRLPGGNAELARANDQIAASALQRWDRSHFADGVRALLVERLPNGVPSQDEVAKLLGMSTRALQRRLVLEQATFQQILDGTRRELAMSYLSESRHSMTEVAYLLGFSGAAAFTRAFRRWTGQAPTQYKKG